MILKNIRINTSCIFPVIANSLKLVQITSARGFSSKMADSTENAFLYFAYGSNLWSKRIRENNREATMVSVAKLEGYKLEFGYWAKRWKGAAANITPDPSSHVYGVLWKLKQSDRESLDKQEGVFDNIYRPLDLVVVTHPEGKQVNCVAYQIREETRKMSREIHGDNLIPSLRYKNVIIEGAKEHGLPPAYVEMLENVRDNGYNGDVEVNIPLTAA